MRVVQSADKQQRATFKPASTRKHFANSKLRVIKLPATPFAHTRTYSAYEFNGSFAYEFNERAFVIQPPASINSARRSRMQFVLQAI